MIQVHHKIKAFTLTEMMVVIVISAIVAGLAFTVLSNVQNSMRSIGHNYENTTQIRSFETALSIDFNTFTTAFWDTKENTLQLSSPIDERRYVFYTDSIVTDAGIHFLKIKERMFFFEGKQVNSGSIDAMKLTFYNTKVPYYLFVFKYNDPTIHF